MRRVGRVCGAHFPRTGTDADGPDPFPLLARLYRQSASVAAFELGYGILQHLQPDPEVGHDRLGMELHGRDRQRDVLDAHHDAVVGRGGDAQLLRVLALEREERVVPARAIACVRGRS